MKHFLNFLVLFLALAYRVEAYADEASLTFIQVSDPQLGFTSKDGTLTQDSLRLEKAVSYINAVAPAFVVVTGDMVNNPGDMNQMSVYKTIISKVNVPVYHVPGNHDIGKCNAGSLGAYRDNYGYDKFSFDYNGCRFIGINTCIIKDGVAAEEEKQYRWLESELQKTDKDVACFVFMHCPVFLKDCSEKECYSNFRMDDRKKYLELLGRYNVKALIAGHLHNNSKGAWNGMEMVTSGSLSRSLGGGTSGICEWTVEKDSYSYRYISLDGIPEYNTLEGLVMAGYQGWFNAPDDGAGLGWKHYNKNNLFVPGSCTIDLWPDVSEYETVYETDFRHEDGTSAYVFSSHDSSTTDLHFRWMKEYGIDGVFMQRFVTSIRSEKGKDNCNHIFGNAIEAARKYGRAVCVMYDLSGMRPENVDLLIEDWKELSDSYGIMSSPDNHYLHHRGKPLVAVWGIGFNDNRKYGYEEAERIIDFFRDEGCSILLGVPAHWRTLKMDALPDNRLHELIMKADVVHPWHVGRFNNESYPKFYRTVEEDAAWCVEHGKDYIPVLFPGFSWYNLQGGVAAPLDQIPRLGGDFLWKQVYGSLKAGCRMLYLAMFDEIDEGTAIFKCSNDVPVGDSPFLSYHGVEPDYYLWLSGQAGKVLRGEQELTEEKPIRKQ